MSHGRAGAGDGPTMSVSGLDCGGHVLRARGRLGVAATVTFRRMICTAHSERPVLVVDLSLAEQVDRRAWQALRTLLVEVHRRDGTALVVPPRGPDSGTVLADVPHQLFPDLAAALGSLTEVELPGAGDGGSAMPPGSPDRRLTDVIVRGRPSRDGPGPDGVAPRRRPAGPVPPDADHERP